MLPQASHQIKWALCEVSGKVVLGVGFAELCQCLLG